MPKVVLGPHEADGHGNMLVPAAEFGWIRSLVLARFPQYRQWDGIKLGKAKVFAELMKIAEMEDDIDNAMYNLLRGCGWNYTCDNPGSVWLWHKKISRGRTLVLGTQSAIDFERMQARPKTCL